MWTLNQPAVDQAEAQLVRALTYANGTPVYPLTAAEKAAVLAIYVSYDQLFGQSDPTLVGPDLGEALCQALLAAYTEVQQDGRLRDLRASLMLIRGACPLCGFGEIYELDHYLPKSVFRPLSIYPRNLVPACHPCNHIKRTLIPNDAARLIHAYYAELPDVPFFIADVAFDQGALTVIYRIEPQGIDAGLAADLAFQIERLKLNDRYIDQINQFMFEQVGMSQAFEAGGAAELKAFLDRSAAALESRFGLNDWRPALFRGVANCDAFCNGGVLDYFAEQ